MKLFFFATLILVYGTQTENSPDDEFCKGCLEFVSTVSPFIKQPEVEEIAQRQCEKCFSFMNETYCEEFVAAYLPALVEKLEDGEPLQRICEDFKFCDMSDPASLMLRSRI